MQRAKRGEEAAWEEICRRFTPLVRKTAGQNHLRSMREDVEAEAWLALAEAVTNYRAELGVPVAGYLASAVRYRIWNRFKSERRRWQREVMAETLPEGRGEDLAQLIETKWQQEEVRAALADLPEGQRRVIEAVFWRGESLTDFAACYGITPQAASQMQKRALVRLKEKLAGMSWCERG